MTKPDLGLPSAIKDSTYQQNRGIEMPAIAFMSKSELRKTIEWMFFEQKQRQEKFLQETLNLNSRIDHLENEEILLRERLQESNRKVSLYQNRYLNLLGEETEENLSVKHLRKLG